MTSAALLTSIDGALQLNKHKKLTTPQKSAALCLVREMLLKVRTTARGTGKWGHGCRGWADWVTRARMRQQRVKWCPKKAEKSPCWDLTDEQFSSKEISLTFDRFVSECPHTSCSSHFQQNMRSIWKTLWNPLPRLSMVGQAVLHKSLSKPKIWSELKISSFRYMIT